MAIIGIDLGTTNSLVSVYRNGRVELLPNEWGQLLTPSCVGVLEDGTVTVGAVAKERLITHPGETAASFKTWMGTQKEFLLGGKVFFPHELSALVLRKLAQIARETLGEEIEEAVISVPAYFNDNQRCATRLAAQLAGLPVKRLINEPSAAALCHSRATPQEEQRLLIVDFGGGTLDVSVVDCFENMVEIVAIAGNNRLGGNDEREQTLNQLLAEMDGFDSSKGVVLLAATTALMLGVNTMFINVMPVKIGRSSGAAVLSGSLNAITYLGAALATWGIGAAAEGFGWGAVFVLWAVMAGTALAVCLLLARPWGRFVRKCEMERGDLV